MREREVLRFHRTSFYKPPPRADEELGPYFHWRSLKEAPPVVFHPYLSFDPSSADLRQLDMLARGIESPQFETGEPE